MKALTPQQIAVQRAVEQLVKERSYPPSITEIAAVAQLSVGSVQKILLKLEAFGYLARTPGIARSLRVVRELGMEIAS